MGKGEGFYYLAIIGAAFLGFYYLLKSDMFNGIIWLTVSYFIALLKRRLMG
ncbi:MAG: hypothetical protein AABX72_00710 [Nanoarchaeota archaeon]